MEESHTIEFKQSWHDDYLKWICGFANASGGKLLIGVNDAGEVVGISNFTTLMEDVPSKARNLMGVTVSVNLLKKDDRFYLEIITPSYGTPISLRGRYYFRSGSTNTELTGNALNEFLMKKFRQTWDDVPEESFATDQLNLQTIEDFKNLAIDRLPGIRAELDPVILLKKLNLIQDGKFKKACILLFGSNPPQHYFKQAHLKIGKFNSDVDVLTSDIVEGNLFQQIDMVMNILTTKYLLKPITYDGIHRREKLEYPYLALREAIVHPVR